MAVRVEAVDELRPLGPVADVVVRARAAAVGAVALDVALRDAAVPDPAARADGTAGFVVLGRTRGAAVDVADAPAAGPMLGRLDADAAVGAVAVLVLEVRERGRMTGEPGPVDEDEAVFGRGGGILSWPAVRAADAAVGAVRGLRLASETRGVADVVEPAFVTGLRAEATALGEAAC